MVYPKDLLNAIILYDEAHSIKKSVKIIRRPTPRKSFVNPSKSMRRTKKPFII